MANVKLKNKDGQTVNYNDISSVELPSATGSTVETFLDSSQYRTSADQDVIDNGKVDKVTGKGLSTNDYTTSDKDNVTANTTARHTHSNISTLNDIDGITEATTLGIDSTVTASSTNLVTSGGVATALEGKVDAVSGKGLSTNDYTSSDKNNVTENTVARHTHENMSTLESIEGSVVATSVDIDTTVTEGSNNLITSGAVFNALSNKQVKAVLESVTISVADWNSGTTCTKNVTGVTSSSIIICDSSNSGVRYSAQGTGTITFTADSTPTGEVTVRVVIL